MLLRKKNAGAIALLTIASLAACSTKKEPRFRLEKATRGDVTAIVTATGTLSAVTTVKVGSQVSGIIAKLYADFNSEVKKGQLLAELDPTPFQATVEQRRADLEKAQVELRNSQIMFQRSERLLKEQLASQQDYDAAKANRDTAAAAVQQSQASLKIALTNLSYAKIASPIDGVVVDRQYDIGQTVAASFQAPTLFTIAQDLTKMQVLTNIDESDIGRVKLEQPARFTVDAFPDIRFRGSVSQIRLSPQTVQNVVTYPVVLDVANPDLKLKPGMTANVEIPVDTRKDTLRVPNAALRFQPNPADLEPGAAKKKEEEKKAAAPGTGTTAPPPETVAAAPQAGGDRTRRGAGEGREPREGRGGMRGGGGEGRPGGGSGGGGRRPGAGRPAEVYVLDPATQKLRPVKVKPGITDGNLTSVESDELKEGDQVVVGLATARAGETGGRPGGGGPRMRM